MRIFQMQRISAIALVIFMTIHMVVVHYPPFHIDFSRIIERMADPLWKGIDIAFLFFVLVHALTGAYMVITDVQRYSRFRRGLAWAAVVIGVAAFIYGAMTIMAFQPETLTAGIN
jgi:succinate dehydrogenase / fumarate reductase membrane anchor subunit